MRTIKKLFCLGFGLGLLQTNVWAKNEISITQDAYQGNTEINCFSKLPPKNLILRTQFIKNFSAYISKQAFVIPLENFNQHLEQIKACFSPEGWQEFSTALARSGNIGLIQAKKYMSNGFIEGNITINHQVNTYVWETETPLTIIYQNRENRVSQRLNVHLRIEQGAQGMVRVTQVVGIPRKLGAPTAG
jgi:hypothetical protein